MIDGHWLMLLSETKILQLIVTNHGKEKKKCLVHKTLKFIIQLKSMKIKIDNIRDTELVELIPDQLDQPPPDPQGVLGKYSSL
jgi:hypothetical protein